MKSNSILALLLAVSCVAGVSATTGSMQEPPTTAESSNQPIDLNAASAAELQTLPGIGPALAARIIEYREEHGAFEKIEELMNVRGIGEKAFLNLRTRIAVTPPPTSER